MNVRCIHAKTNTSVVVEQSGMKENVQIIRQKEVPVEQKRKLRVAAYCRVSTDKDEQKSSIDIQMKKIVEKGKREMAART